MTSHLLSEFVKFALIKKIQIVVEYTMPQQQQQQEQDKKTASLVGLHPVSCDDDDDNVVVTERPTGWFLPFELDRV